MINLYTIKIGRQLSKRGAMLPQVEMTQRLRQLCQADSRPVAASAALQPQDLERAYRAAWGGVLT
jgi:hypothetical protein